jgi:hypothetical protein
MRTKAKIAILIVAIVAILLIPLAVARANAGPFSFNIVLLTADSPTG